MASAGLKRRIVVIDDDFDIRSMLTLVLEMGGYEVVAAANGREALERLRGGPPAALILLDLMMPVMNGWQFCDVRREDPGLMGIPLIVLSGDGRIAEKVAAMGASGYLRKPIDMDELLDAVRGYC